MKKLVLLFFLFSLKVFSFQQKDSLEYYVNLYEKTETIDNLDNALRFFEKDKELYLSSYPQRASYDLYYISKIQYKFGDPYSSEKSSVEGLRLLEGLSIDDRVERRKRSFYNHLGILSRDLENYKDSFLYYSKALNLCKTKRDSALIYNNISTNFMDSKEYHKAEQKLLLSTKFFKELNDSSFIALSMSNLGLVQSKLNEKGALNNLKKALQIRTVINDPLIYESYKYITEYFLDRKDISRAKYYAKKGYDEAIKFNSLSYKYEALFDLIKLGEDQYALEFTKITEEMFKNNDLKRNTYALAKYNIQDEQERTKKNELRAIKSEAKNMRNLLIAGLALLLLAFMFFVFRSHYKKGKLKQQFETEQKISKKVHDEIANDVFHVMTKVQGETVNKSELVDNLDGIYHKTRDISKANADVDVSKDYESTLNDLINSFKIEDVNIFTSNTSKILWSTVSDNKKKVLYRVVQELMTNMRKHSKADLVTLNFEKKKNKIAITYVDNGIGCDFKKGNGLRNTENRMEMVSGTITFESETNQGFRANLIL